MASAAADAPSRPPAWRQTLLSARFGRVNDAVERWLEAERESLPLWIPVALGGGVVLWFVLPDAGQWLVAELLLGAAGLACLAVGRGGRLARALAVAAMLAAAGLALIGWRAEHVASPVLGGPVVASFDARVERIEPLPARAGAADAGTGRTAARLEGGSRGIAPACARQSRPGRHAAGRRCRWAGRPPGAADAAAVASGAGRLRLRADGVVRRHRRDGTRIGTGDGEAGGPSAIRAARPADRPYHRAAAGQRRRHRRGARHR